MPYGRSSIAPYYLNTIAKIRAEKEMQEKRIEAEKDAAAKDRWFKGGMGVVDIASRFGLAGFDDYLQRRREMEKTIGPKSAVIAGFDKPAAEPTAQAAPAPAPEPTIKAPLPRRPAEEPGLERRGRRMGAPTPPPPSLRKPPETKLRLGPAMETRVQDRPLPKAVSEARAASPALAKIMGEPGREALRPEQYKGALEAPELRGPSPSVEAFPDTGLPERAQAPETAAKIAKEDPVVSSPPLSGDSELEKWRKEHWKFIKSPIGTGVDPGLPPEATSKDQGKRGFIQANGKYLSSAEMRKKFPDDDDLYKAVYASKILENNKVDMDMKRAQIENMAYNKRTRPLRLAEKSLDLQLKVHQGKLSFQAGKAQYQRLLLAVEKFNKGRPIVRKGKIVGYAESKYKIKIGGKHPLFTDQPNIYFPSEGIERQVRAAARGGVTGKTPTSKTPARDDTAYGMADTWSRIHTEGGAQSSRGIRLFDHGQVRAAMVRVNKGSWHKKTKSWTDPHRILDKDKPEANRLAGELLAIKDVNSSEFKEKSRSLGELLTSSNQKAVPRQPTHPGKGSKEERARAAKASADIKKARTGLVTQRGKYLTEITALNSKSSLKSILAFGGSRPVVTIGKGEDAKPLTIALSKDDIPESLVLGGEYPKFTGQKMAGHKAAEAKKIISAARDRYKSKKEAILKRYGFSLEENWSTATGEEYNREKATKWFDSESRLPKYKKAPPPGGPAGAATPGGGQEAGLNPEQTLWLKWESQGISKKQKQIGYSRDLRLLQSTRRRLA